MKNECHIVRDLMPLYTEGMLSNESAAFVKTHLETCEDCRGAYSAVRSHRRGHGAAHR